MTREEDAHFRALVEKLKANPAEAQRELDREIERTSRGHGIQAAFNQLLRLEVLLGWRKPTLALYDHAIHFIGGAQKYGLTLAAALEDIFDITILANQEVSHQNFLDWYNLDLSRCPIKVLKLPYYEAKKATHLDPALVTSQEPNPFHPVSRESGNYDIFVNNSMNEMVYPLANVSVLICHFPERRPRTYFYADRYDCIVFNSRYTSEWIEKKWKIPAHEHIYPYVEARKSVEEKPKKKIILSVARFEVEGTKRQKEMIETFLRLDTLYPEAAAGWKFILAGGSSPDNQYLSLLETLVGKSPRPPIEFKVNISAAELESLYDEATLFWHLCGLIQDDPSAVEHFGMTTIEAMQHGVVPIVYDGGGLREIVDDGVNGFRVKSTAALLERTLELFQSPELVHRLAEAAQKKAQEFSREKFETRVRALFGRILKEYKAPSERLFSP
ncbi:MAG: glycosyltransferase family 4 protein [Candidatus Aminicenantales bacterium]